MIIKENKVKINSIDRLSTIHLLDFNSLLKDLRELIDIENKGSFLTAYRDLKDYLLKDQVNKLPKVVQALSNKALESLVNLPKGYKELETKIQTLKANKYANDVLSCLDLNGEFELNNDKLENWKDSFRIRVTEKGQIDRAKSLNALTDKINELNLLSFGNLTSILRVLMIDEGKVIPKPDSIINGY